MNHTMAIGILAAGLAVGSTARADLSSPLYIQGKAAYAAGHWDEAVSKLGDYEVADAAFLSKNPGIKSKIDEAIRDASDHRKSAMVTLHGIETNGITSGLPGIFLKSGGK